MTAPPPPSYEDFSFPTFSEPYFSGIDSPPLWRLSPSASPLHNPNSNTNQNSDNEEDEEAEEFKDCYPLHENTQRKSFSYVENTCNINNVNNEEDKEPKMDLLWEDFNEELFLNNKKDFSRFENDDLMNNIGCVQSLRLSNKNGSNNNKNVLVSHKKSSAAASPGFVVFIKVLKKLFLLRNSHHHHQISVHRSRNRRAKNRSW